MSTTTQTDTQDSNRPTTSAAEWTLVSWKWRRPRILEVTGTLTALPVAASIGGYVPDGVPSLVTVGAFALHAVADLVARCIQRDHGESAPAVPPGSTTVDQLLSGRRSA
ncbi:MULTISPECIES: hypothetical protein [unclassified Streptomyces]|uniref:hypothetical protein n=1 Tax=unclassified Streptomyces TaxID=2593676 RepID=UPI0011802C60|nr:MULTISPECIES: hypothetical protein [unclassified Streptomyces]